MAKDYKDTLNLPKTGFPMKASLAQMEPEMLGFWESEKIYEKMKLKNSGGPRYVLHDGPPYANGHIHIGHALNKILKDIIVKYKAMRGFYSPYVPGWDCHGLPIELEVEKKLKNKDVGILEKRAMCRGYAAGFVDIQREEFKRLGVFGDWQNPYLTMSFGYEASIARELFEFVKKGYVYRGKKPVHWCPSCVTALAEAEVEYAEKQSPSIYVKFRVADDGAAGPSLQSLKGREAYFVIWTTTPWTLPANLALAVNPDVEYAAVEADGAVYIIAKDLLDALKEKLSLGGIVSTFKGNNLLGMTARHPFINRQSKVISGDFVTTEEGTGVVHIAPGHGEDDYEAGLREGLDIYAPVDERGKFNKVGAPELEGQFVFKANDLILDILKGKGALLHVEKITHSYPHCWRCKKPVIFRATVQWFISLGHEDLRGRSLREIDSVGWIPSWGRDRIYGMVKGRPDWCISRQRSWGVPIALLTCAGCESILYDVGLFDGIVKLFEEQGADVWFKFSAGELAAGRKCSKCGGGDFRKEADILDVWFDSGVSYTTLEKPGGTDKEGSMTPPAEMYLEGSDQHRGWFQSSLLASVGTRDKAPYRTVLTHGFVVDGKGKKMSKSLGNVVSPNDVMVATGAEILRLWVSAEDYKDDIRISNEIISRLTEAYRKIRNTARFLLANTNDFTPDDFTPPYPPLTKGGYEGGYEIDRWAMSRLQGLIGKVTDAYERFDFHEVYHLIYDFCVVDMSSFYLDILKDRLYTFGKDSPERRAAQRVLREILIAMTKLMAPVLSFTAEEIWKFIKGRPGESVFLSEFPVIDGNSVDEELELKWQRLIALRNEVNKALELKRAGKFIGNSLEAKVVLYPGKEAALAAGYADFLTTLFIVSQVELGRAGEGEFRSDSIEGLSVSVERAEGLKCARCWNYSTKVGSFPDEEEVCERCHKVLGK